MDNEMLIGALDISSIEIDDAGNRWLILMTGQRVLIGGHLYDTLVDLSVVRGGDMCYRVASPEDQPTVGNITTFIYDDADKFSRCNIGIKITGFVRNENAS